MSDEVRPLTRKGRGATANDTPRFESLTRERIDDGWGSGEEELPPLRTTLTVDTSRTVLARNQSPDVPFDRSVNPYRGCEHGCIYCFARPTHAFLGLSPGLDFETRLTYKPDAADRLREELSKPGYKADTLVLGANTDAYQPVERRLRITRSIVELLAECRHPLGIVTKSALVERDIDVLAAMAADNLVSVCVSVTTLDHELARRMEPRATAPRRRLRTIETLAAAGIQVTVLVAPIIPVINDAEIERILETVAGAGARGAGYVLLRLSLEINQLFQDWLAEHYPLKAGHVMNRIRDMRGGAEYESTFGTRMRGRGLFADLIAQRFAKARERFDLAGERPPLSTDLFRPPAPRTATGETQLDMF